MAQMSMDFLCSAQEHESMDDSEDSEYTFEKLHEVTAAMQASVRMCTGQLETRAKIREADRDADGHEPAADADGDEQQPMPAADADGDEQQPMPAADAADSDEPVPAADAADSDEDETMEPMEAAGLEQPSFADVLLAADDRLQNQEQQPSQQPKQQRQRRKKHTFTTASREQVHKILQSLRPPIDVVVFKFNDNASEEFCEELRQQDVYVCESVPNPEDSFKKLLGAMGFSFHKRSNEWRCRLRSAANNAYWLSGNHKLHADTKKHISQYYREFARSPTNDLPQFKLIDEENVLPVIQTFFPFEPDETKKKWEKRKPAELITVSKLLRKFHELGKITVLA